MADSPTHTTISFRLKRLRLQAQVLLLRADELEQELVSPDDRVPVPTWKPTFKKPYDLVEVATIQTAYHCAEQLCFNLGLVDCPRREALFNFVRELQNRGTASC